MRWNRLSVRGFGPFVEETSVDLGSIDGTLIAVTGDNGAGKSTALELLAGALYRRTPTRGSLADLATSRDAFVEVEVVNGQRWTVRQTVDGKNGKGEAVVLDEAGAPVLPSGKVREADLWVASHLPTPEVLYNSVFAPQGSGGFLELKPGDRKAVVLRVLGCERLEALSEKAREHGRAARGRADVLSARIADERQRGGDVAGAARELEEARGRAEQADRDLATARAELAELEQEAEQAREELRAEQEVQQRIGELRRRRDDATTRVQDLEVRIANNRRVLDDADQIRAAARRHAELEQQLAEARERSAAGRAAADGVRRRFDDASRAAREASTQARVTGLELERARADVAGRRTAVEEAEAELAGRRTAVEEAAAALRRAEAELERLRGLRVAGADDRIDALRGALVSIEAGDDEPQRIATDALIADFAAAQASEEIPAQTRAATEAAGFRRKEAEKAASGLVAAEREAAGRDALRAVEEAAEAMAQRREDASRRAEAAEHEVETIRAEIGRAAAESAALVERVTRLTDELAELAGVAKRAQALEHAEARLAELGPELAEAEATQTAAGRELADLEEAQPAGYQPPAVPDVAPLRRRVDELLRAQAAAAAAVTVLETRVTTAKAAAERLEALEAERRQVDAELADWRRLGEDLGRDGLQAMEIDAAGPELTELVNDLLRSCVGSRWTVSIETSRLSADGKRQIEDCEVRVVDTKRGRDGAAVRLSGGERVIVGEAVSLALSMLACRRAGVSGPTLVRDESGAALDPTNSRAYVAMLRRAAEIVGASHVLFVSHNDELNELADARIVVRDGRLEVQA